MPYQNVARPRFYINLGSFFEASGIGLAALFHDFNPPGYATVDQLRQLTQLDPTKDFNYTPPGWSSDTWWGETADPYGYVGMHGINFVFFLGHKFVTNGNRPIAYSQVGVDWVFPGSSYGDVLVNMSNTNASETFNNGWSMVAWENGSFEDSPFRISITGTPIQCNSIVFGRHYTMPHSPDLNLTMTREMDGVKRIRTKGGSDLINQRYIKSPLWRNAAPWELYTTSTAGQKTLRQGRRIWDLSFSYLRDSDIFPEHSNLLDHETAGSVPPYTDGTILKSNDFYSQVIHKTNGGQLPFIFQPDKDDTSEFAIAKFDMDSFEFNQVANSVYNVKLKIREVW